MLYIEVPVDWKVEKDGLKGILMDAYGNRHTNADDVNVGLVYQDEER